MAPRRPEAPLEGRPPPSRSPPPRFVRGGRLRRRATRSTTTRSATTRATTTWAGSVTAPTLTAIPHRRVRVWRSPSAPPLAPALTRCCDFWPRAMAVSWLTMTARSNRARGGWWSWPALMSRSPVRSRSTVRPWTASEPPSSKISGMPLGSRWLPAATQTRPTRCCRRVATILATASCSRGSLSRQITAAVFLVA